MLKKFMLIGATALTLAACGTGATEEVAKEATVETSTAMAEQTKQLATSKEKTVEQTQPAEITPETKAEQTKPTETIPTSDLETAVTLEDAVAIFQKAHPDAQIHSVDLDSKRGSLQYEITGFDQSNEYEMKINAETKEVLRDEREREDDREEVLNFTAIIDPSVAIKTASAHSQVAGISPISWSLEVDDGIQEYTIEYRQNSTQVEIHMNAETGEIYEVEIDD